MKKALVLGALMALALPTLALAKIDGNCADCHTMHNSKAGAPMAMLQDGSPSLTPFPVLLISDCIGCHASGGDAAVADFNGSSVPQVYHTDTNDLAGGNFAYIDNTKENSAAAANDRMGHNVVDILDADATLQGPPGMARGLLSGTHSDPNTYVANENFTCAGNDGCHGIRNRALIAGTAENTLSGTIAVAQVKVQGLKAMTGSHHYNVDGRLDASTAAGTKTANSYRFLRGAFGVEDADWQDTQSASDHNDYFGVAGLTTTGCTACHSSGTGAGPTNTMTTPGGSISGFCSTCHGLFHGDSANTVYTDPNTGVITTDTNFVRHPVDYALPNKTEYAAYTAYDVNAPIARANFAGIDKAVVTPGGGNDLVMCLSCHVAHGSADEGMLRFNYDDMVAGGGSNTTGCFVCHSTKDTGDFAQGAGE